MGASVAPVEVRFSATGIEAVRAGMRSVREEAQGMGAGTAAAGKEVSEGLSHGATIDLERGVSSPAGARNGLIERACSRETSPMSTSISARVPRSAP